MTQLQISMPFQDLTDGQALSGSWGVSGTEAANKSANM